MRSAKSFKNHARLPDIVNINTRICIINQDPVKQELCIINQDPVRTLATFRSGHHGSITNDLSEPYSNLGKILVRSPWPNLAW